MYEHFIHVLIMYLFFIYGGVNHENEFIKERGTLHTYLVVDWNGTVMSDVERAVLATNEVLKDYDLAPLNVLAFRESFTLPMSEWLTDLGVPEEFLDTAEAKWNEGMQNPAPMREGAADLIRELKNSGTTLGVVTAANQRSLDFDIEAAELQGVFDVLRSSAANKAQSLSELRKEKCRYVYVGDTTYDVLSARSAGYETVAISGGYQSNARLRTASPDHFAYNFEDLRSIVLG